MSDNGKRPEEHSASDEIEEFQQDENLTQADRMDFIANAVAEDAEASAEDPEATEGETGSP